MDGMLTNSSVTAAAEAWLDAYGAAIASGDVARIAALFAEDCCWRDILAFTWDLRTTSGAPAIADRMVPTLARMAPRGIALAAGRTNPRRVTRAGVDAIEAIFAFETSVAPATVWCAWCPRVGRRAPGR
jgi:putative flavoprotein involved in K+ transport